MATLPTVYDFGRRPTPNPQRQMATVSPRAATAVADAWSGIGDTASKIGFDIIDREATAAAKERDALVSDQIRSLLYDPQSGFMNMEGGSAVNQRQSILDRLDSLKSSAMEGLSSPAQKKFQDALTNRIESAKQSVDTHTSSARKTWLDGASSARIESAYQDSLVDPASTEANIATITNELRGKAVRDGWSSEQLDLETQKATSKVYNDQALRIASRDPISALQFLRSNQDKMLPSDIVNLEAQLQPAVKEATGRARGGEAFNATGDLTGAMALAAQNIGLNERQQGAALQEYMANGGVNLDPATTAWCAAYVNATLAQAGIAGTGSNLARSFLNWGDAVSVPQKGDLVVLSRGDPNGPQGHVGFFDGFNEDGSVRILGGNQGDAVSIASYSADRVLGYRRAGKSDVKVQPGISSLLDIQDPVERKAALEEYNLRTTVKKAQTDAFKASARDAAFQMIEAGGNVMDLPLEQRQALGEQAMSGLMEYQGKKLRKQPIETDPQTYLALRQAQANDPVAFKAMDMTQYVGKLSETDWQQFVDAQNKPRDSVTATAASTLMETAKRQMQAAGIDPTPKEGSDAAAQVASIQTQLLQWQDAYIKDKGQAPSQIEIDRQTAKMLTNITINPSGPMNERDVRAFELGGVDIGAEKLAGSDITVGDVTYPSDRVSEAADALRAAGIPVTAENLVTILGMVQ